MNLKFIKILVLFVLVVGTSAIARADTSFPRFRHIDPEAKQAADLPKVPIKLLADEDFAPYSFPGTDGLQKGIAIDLARSACQELQLTCEIVTKPFAELLAALENGEGDLVVTGIKLSGSAIALAEMTRPFFVSTAQFVTKSGSQLKDTDIRTLAGRRIGYVKDTSHGAFVEKYYGRSDLVSFPGETEMLAALKAGSVDLAFGDSMHVSFWLNGEASQSCCSTLGKPFVDRKTFSRGMVFMVNRERQGLRQAFDYALDRLEESGETGKIFARYVPVPLW
jgi:polar amino acid transport system substrate-binding protein